MSNTKHTPVIVLWFDNAEWHYRILLTADEVQKHKDNTSALEDNIEFTYVPFTVIAAAPELLYVCKDIIELWTEGMPLDSTTVNNAVSAYKKATE